MGQVLNPGSRQRLGNGVRQILQDHPPRQVRVPLPELRALMPDAAAYVDVDCSVVVLCIPALGLFSHRIDRQPRQLGLAAESHVVVKVAEMFGVLSEPRE